MSVRIEFDLDQIYPETAAAIIAMLEKKFNIGTMTPVKVLAVPAVPTQPASQTPSASSARLDTSTEPQPEAKRRGRPRKDVQPEATNADPTPAPAQAESGSAASAAPSAEPPSQSAPAGETGPKSYTLDELRSGLQTYTGKHDLVKAKALLKSFGCDRITELAEKGPEVHRQFMKECEA